MNGIFVHNDDVQSAGQIHAGWYVQAIDQDSVTMGHGSDLLALYDLFAKSLYHQGALRACLH